MSQTLGKASKLICLALVTLLLTGCWNLEEVENRAFVLNLGFDAGTERRVRVTAQIPSPEAQTQTPGGATGQSTVLTISAEGETAWHALGELDKEYPRKLYLGHLQAVVIGTKLAEQGVDDVFDAVMRFWETDRHAHVLLADDVQGVLAHQTPSIVNPGLYVRQFFLSTIGIEGVSDPRAWRVWRDTVSPHLASFAPYVHVDGSQLNIGGYGLFLGGKLVRRLDDTASRGVNWLRGDITTASLPLPWREGTVTVRNTVGNVRTVAAGWRGDKPYIDLAIEVTGEIQEIVPVDALFEAADFREVEAQLAKIVEAEALLALEQTREVGTDVFMFGEWVRIGEPARWDPQSWPEHFKDIEVGLQVKTRIRSTDLLR